MEELITDILSKKELKGLDETLVKEFLKDFFNKNKKTESTLKKKAYNKRSEEYKQTIKEIRKKLREIHGVFIEKNYSKKSKLLSDLKKENKTETIKKILKLHTSTSERLPYYTQIYKQIIQITGKGSILDLGCGLNPISYSFLEYKPKYVASDISSDNLEFIDKFFKKMKINGKTNKIDLVNEYEKLSKIKMDICFLFKTLDSLETRKRNISKTIIDKIQSRWIIISFPKISLGGKKTIKKSKRGWFFNFLKYNYLKYTSFETDNELFFIIEK